MLALVGLLSLLILAYQYLLPADTHLLLPYLIITFASIPQLVLIVYIVYHPLRGTNARGQNTEQLITDSLPDRLVHPDQYRPLLPAESEFAHQQDSMESRNHG